MSHALRITKRLHVTPLCDIHQQEAAQAYVEGLYESLSNHRKPVSISFLVSRLQRAIARSVFDGQHQHAARHFVGYHLGAMHGTILTENGIIRQDGDILAVLDTADARRSYCAGRHWFFYEAMSQEQRVSDDYLIGQLSEIAEGCTRWHDPDAVWQFTIACILGELSGQVFLLTQEEQTCWDAQERAARIALARQDTQRNTEPLDPLPVVEYTV